MLRAAMLRSGQDANSLTPVPPPREKIEKRHERNRSGNKDCGRKGFVLTHPFR
jgi:hypothetical protein